MPFSTAMAENVAKLFKNEAATKYEKGWVKLHTGNPGAACTSNAATEATRKSCTFTGTTTLKNVAEMLWEAVSTKEKYTHFSVWSAESAGTALGYGELAEAKEPAAGDDVRFKASALELPIKTS